MHRKNAEIAEDEVDASDIAAIRYVEDLALLRETPTLRRTWHP